MYCTGVIHHKSPATKPYPGFLPPKGPPSNPSLADCVYFGQKLPLLVDNKTSISTCKTPVALLSGESNWRKFLINLFNCRN